VLLAIKKQGIKLLWHGLAHEGQTVRCLMVEHFTPGAKRSGVSGTDHKIVIDVFYLLIYIIYLFVVHSVTLSVAQTMQNQ
jgi:hypothetical protein